jgi:hypothetical protein
MDIIENKLFDEAFQRIYIKLFLSVSSPSKKDFSLKIFIENITNTRKINEVNEKFLNDLINKFSLKFIIRGKIIINGYY